MNVGFSDSQMELRAAVRGVLADRCTPGFLRELLADPERWRPLWETITELGWPTLALLDGEAGLGVIELVVVLEECGAAAAPVPLLSSAGLTAGALRAAGDGGREVQAELASGAVGALVATRSGARGLRELPLRLVGGRLVGSVGPVADAVRAELFVLLAESDAGTTTACVVRPGPGVALRPVDSIDPTRPLAELVVDVAPELVLPVDRREALALPLVASAAELVGVGSRLLDLSVAHALTRQQFGQLIGAFQGIKHRLADCFVGLERARSLLYAAAMLIDNPDASTVDRWRAALLAKAAAGEGATECARAAVQVHGAIATTWEHDVHLFLRRAWQSAALLGESRALYAEAGALLVEVG